MNIKHLQLNTSLLKQPEAILNFLTHRQIDIACFQEICYPIDTTNSFSVLLTQHNYSYIEGVHFHYHPNNQTLAVAIASRWPILDYSCWYYNTPTFSPKNIHPADQLFSDLINNNYPDYPASRGLVNSVKSRCILSAVINTPSGPIRLLTTHFSVSDLCSETSQMYDMSQLIHSIVKHSKPIPTIFSADLNVRPQSYSVAKISEVLTCHTFHLTDTLSSTHKAKLHDFPQGLAVDHVFSCNLNHQGTEVVEIDFSEHRALVSNFVL